MASNRQIDYMYKIVIIGDSGVGKTNLLSRYTSNTFKEDSRATIGVELLTKTMEINGDIVQNHLWDTAGQQRFRAITTAYYRNAVGAVVVFDLTKSKSFENLSRWFKQLDIYADSLASIMLVGNKSDLVELREIKLDTIEQFVNQNKICYLQTSALNGDNVDESFQRLIRNIHQKQRNRQRKPKSITPEKRRSRSAKAKDKVVFGYSQQQNQSVRIKLEQSKKKSKEKACC